MGNGTTHSKGKLMTTDRNSTIAGPDNGYATRALAEKRARFERAKGLAARVAPAKVERGISGIRETRFVVYVTKAGAR
jgi:hypothetical protein